VFADGRQPLSLFPVAYREILRPFAGRHLGVYKGGGFRVRSGVFSVSQSGSGSLPAGGRDVCLPSVVRIYVVRKPADCVVPASELYTVALSILGWLTKSLLYIADMV